MKHIPMSILSNVSQDRQGLLQCEIQKQTWIHEIERHDEIRHPRYLRDYCPVTAML